MYTRRLFL